MLGLWLALSRAEWNCVAGMYSSLVLGILHLSLAHSDLLAAHILVGLSPDLAWPLPRQSPSSRYHGSASLVAAGSLPRTSIPRTYQFQRRQRRSGCRARGFCWSP